MSDICACVKRLNGPPVFELAIHVTFEFTREEADRFLATKPELRQKLLDEFLLQRHPLPETLSYNAEKFYEAIGKGMTTWREMELQGLLPEPTEPKQISNEN